MVKRGPRKSYPDIRGPRFTIIWPRNIQLCFRTHLYVSESARSLPGRWRSGTTAPPLNTGRRFEPRRGRWRSEGWVLIPGGGFLAVERGAGRFGLELEDSAAFAFGGRQYLVTCTMPTRKED